MARGSPSPSCPVQLSLDQFVADFGLALKAVDATAPQGGSRTRIYQPGVGPLTEADAVGRAVRHLREIRPGFYGDAAPRPYPGSRQTCDLVIPGSLAIEFKLIRPFGDNGLEAEHWSENVLHPYAGNTSSISDCLKLLEAGFAEAKAVVVFGYEHTPPRIPLETAVRAFEVISRDVLGIKLGTRHEAQFSGLIHPVHQQGKVYGWDVLG
jgi:hypothetical protein